MRTLLVIIAILSLLVPALAHAEVISVADNIPVAATADNATDARSIAISKGEQEAFRKIITQMEPARAESIIRNTPPERISNMVRGYEVSQEKVTSNSYQATLRYNFDPRLIAFVLGDTSYPNPAPNSYAGVALKNKAQAPKLDSILVIPIWNDNGVVRLWENENIWRLIWRRAVIQQGMGRIVMPYGDKRDTDDIEAVRALRFDHELFKPILARYGATEVWTVLADVDPNDPKQQLKVTIRKLLANQPEAKETLKYPLKTNETLNAQMERVAMDILGKLKHEEESVGADAENQINTVSVRMLQVDMKDWERIRAKLLKVPAVIKIDLTNVSYFQTDMLLTYRGTPELLGKMLAAAEFRLFKDNNVLVLALQ